MESQYYLDKAYTYFNFYMGIVSAILAATLAGVLDLDDADDRAWLLLLGPSWAIGLTLLGYRTVRVFYRRSMEAWVSQVNLEQVVGIGQEKIGKPRFPSENSQGWLAKFERPRVKKVLETDPGAEVLVKKLTRIGDTMVFATLAFGMFTVGALVMGVAIILVAVQ